MNPFGWLSSLLGGPDPQHDLAYRRARKWANDYRPVAGHDGKFMLTHALRKYEEVRAAGDKLDEKLLMTQRTAGVLAMILVALTQGLSLQINVLLAAALACLLASMIIVLIVVRARLHPTAATIKVVVQGAADPRIANRSEWLAVSYYKVTEAMRVVQDWKSQHLNVSLALLCLAVGLLIPTPFIGDRPADKDPDPAEEEEAAEAVLSHLPGASALSRPFEPNPARPAAARPVLPGWQLAALLEIRQSSSFRSFGKCDLLIQSGSGAEKSIGWSVRCVQSGSGGGGAPSLSF